MTKLAKFFLILLLSLPMRAAAQSIRYIISPKNAETVLKLENIRESVDFLSREALGGRATGSAGARQAATWLDGKFRELELLPIGGAWMHGFNTPFGMGRNVMGLIPGNASNPRYVILMAHYDHIGTLGGTVYPGADSNASGVAALLEVARMFRHMRFCQKSYGSSLLVVALDAKEKDLGGAAELWRLIEQKKLTDPSTGQPITPEMISMAVNLDQLGATLSPLTKGNPQYVMMLSDETTGRRLTLESVNRAEAFGLEIGYDYYGSKDFTNLFFRRISDQRVFLEHGIPAVMFTSGITLNNNKVTDTAETLDYPILRKRIQLVFYWLDKIL